MAHTKNKQSNIERSVDIPISRILGPQKDGFASFAPICVVEKDVLSDLRELYRQGYVSFQYISISFFVPIIFLHTLSSSILTLLVGDAESL